MNATIAKSKRQLTVALQKIMSAAREYAAAEKALAEAMRAEQPASDKPTKERARRTSE